MNDVQAFGRFEGKTHILPLRIYYEDTDLSGVVYHANYLRYMERGRSEYFRAAGITRLAMLEEAEPTAWTIRKAALDYFKPARVDDLIEVHTICTGADRRAHDRGSEDLYEGHIAHARPGRGLHHHPVGQTPPHSARNARQILEPLVVETDA